MADDSDDWSDQLGEIKGILEEPRPLYMIACNSVGFIDAIDISIELGEVRQVHGKSQMFPDVPSFGSLGSAQQGSELNMTQAIHYCLRALPAMVEWWNSQGPPG